MITWLALDIWVINHTSVQFQLSITIYIIVGIYCNLKIKKQVYKLITGQDLQLDFNF